MSQRKSVQSALQSLALLSHFMAPQMALAKPCHMTVTREVCPDKSAKELLAPYGNQKEFEENYDMNSLKECLDKAEVASKILRPGQFLSKKVDRIFFDQKAVEKIFEDRKDCKNK